MKRRFLSVDKVNYGLDETVEMVLQTEEDLGKSGFQAGNSTNWKIEMKRRREWILQSRRKSN